MTYNSYYSRTRTLQSGKTEGGTHLHYKILLQRSYLCKVEILNMIKIFSDPIVALPKISAVLFRALHHCLV